MRDAYGRFRKLPTAGWWPRGTPEEGVGELLRVFRARSGAVLGVVRLSDGREVTVPWSPRFRAWEVMR